MHHDVSHAPTRQLARYWGRGGGEGGRHGLKSGCSSRKQQAAMLQMAGSSGFEDILALVAARPPAVASPSFAVVGDDVDGIEELQILAAAQPRQTHGVFGFRTKASTSHARGCKRGLRLVLQLGSEKVRSKRLEAGLAIVGKMHPTICKALCLPTSSSMVSQDQMSAVYLRVAASSKIKGKHLESQGKVQASITHSVASCLTDLQYQHVKNLICPQRAGRLPGGMRICSLAAQWDETSQKLAALLRGVPLGTKRSRMQVAAQVMAFSGAVHRFVARSADDGPGTISHYATAWRVKPLRLEGTDTDFLLEAVMRSLPVDFRSIDAAAEACEKHDWFICSTVLDRAASNLACCRWFCGHFESELRQGNLLFWMEPCAAHGISLVKGRPKIMKDLSAAMYSMTRWMRISHNQELFARALKDKLSSLVVVLDQSRPANDRAESLNMIELIYGSLNSSFLWRKCHKTGQLLKSPFHRDLVDLCNVINLQGTSTTIYTWNRVARGSYEHETLGLKVGGKIFSSDAEAKDKVIAAVLNILVFRAWVTATVSRWTNVGATWRRSLLGVLMGRSLPSSIEDVKLGLKLADDLETALARLVEADKEDHSSRNKLRLIRFARVLAGPDLGWHLAVLVASSGPVDKLLYQVLGHDHDRCSLSDLVHPISSPLVACHNRLLVLALSFHRRDGSPWMLLPKVGADMYDQVVKRFARRQILQLAAGITQIFELRMSDDVYRASWLAFGDLPDDVKLNMVRTLYQKPPECHSYMLFHIRRAYPTAASLSKAGPVVFRAWLESTETSIDFSERAHAQFRRDLATPGPSASFSQACDRLVVRQMVAEHVRLGGSDPALVPIADSFAVNADATISSSTTSAREGQGGSAFLEYSNMRLGVLKALDCPDESMSPEQLRECRANINKQWKEVRCDQSEYNNWLAVSNSKRVQCHGLVLCRSGPDEKPGSGSSSFCGLWGRSKDRCHLIPPEDLVQFQAEQKKTKKKTMCKNEIWSMAEDDNLVSNPPRRKENSLPFSGSLHGCHSTLKNICRIHGPITDDMVSTMHALCYRFSRWVDSLPADVRVSAEALLMCYGSDTPADEPNVVMAALLVHPSGNPKAQLFAQVGLQVGCGSLSEFAPPQLPFTLEILRRTSRMAIPGSISPSVQAIAIYTSDEFAHMLWKSKPVWKFHKAEYTIGGGDSLLIMEVSSIGPVIELPKRIPKAAPRVVVLPDVFDLGDPFAYGQARAARAGTEPSSSAFPAASSSAGPAAASVDDSDASDGDAAPPSEFAADVFDEMYDAQGVPEVDDDEIVEGWFGFDGDDITAEVLDEALGACMTDDADFGCEPPPPVVEDEATRLRQAAIDAAIKDDAGFITTTVEPWASCSGGGAVGRISKVWPANALVDKQSISVKCFMHSGCSFARKRARVSDAAMLKWLFSSKPLPLGCTHEEAQTSKRAHGMSAVVFL